MPDIQDDEAIRQALQWIRATISEPVLGLEGLGPICPWARKALDSGAVHLSVCEPDVKHDDLEAALSRLILGFHQDAAFDDAPLYRVAGLVVPRLSETTYQLLRDVHAGQKLQAVRRGLMLGLFHPLQTRPSLTHNGIETMISPVPMILVRNMLMRDLKIIDNPALPPERRVERLDAFLEWRRNHVRFTIDEGLIDRG